MARFIRRFDMAEDQIVFVQHFGRLQTLTRIVGVVKAGHSFDFVNVPAEEDGQAAEEIYAGDHAAGVDVEFVFEFRHVWGVALAPEPDLGCGVFSGGFSGAVDFVIG